MNDSFSTTQKYINSFNNTSISNKEVTDRISFNVNFVCNPFVEIIGNSNDNFKVEFIDGDEIVYSSIISSNMWCKCNRSYFTDWRIRIQSNDKIVYDEKINLQGKRVYISFESKSLGDTLAWFPYVDEFRKKHNCDIIVSTFLNELFIEQYPNLEFVHPGQIVNNIYAQYRIGWFYDGDDYNKNLHPYEFKNQPLQKTASDILGLEYKEIKPKLKVSHLKSENKKVGIAIHSTSQAKYWNNPNGWQEVVDFLISNDYEVILYSKEGDGYMGNYHPKGVGKFEGTIEQVMENMSQCEFFIGIGSGLSWLSWAIDVPTFIISGFSDDYTETQLNTFRIINKSVCNGCFNTHRLDPGDWNWCPLFKNTDRQFECTRKITSDMVIDEIKKLITVSESKIECKYDYIEIGTSDFDTLIETLPESYKGLSIEPIKHYLDKLPNLENNQKINVAISDKDEIIKIYLVEPEDIQKYNLPDWIKGCNSIGKEHPSVLRYLIENDLLHIYKSYEVETLSFNTLVNRYGISEIDYLKIDTEGHDFTIIRDMLTTNIRPKKIKFEANSLYKEEEILNIVEELKSNNYIVLQRTFDDVVVRYRSDIDSYLTKLPILVISSGRRFDYLSKTIKSLFDHDINFNNKIESVWLLDDRSSEIDRFHTDKLMKSYFGDKYTSVYFNSNEPFKFVEKFKFIKKVVSEEDVVLLLEDDWECHGDLSLSYHINNLINSDWTQIAFADPLEIQDNYIIKNSIINFDYWKNPWPDFFKHPHRWDGDICHWNKCSINNYTNNPSLIKGSVFHKVDYNISKSFEWEFSQVLNGNQVFTNECLFRHFGQNSLIGQI